MMRFTQTLLGKFSICMLKGFLPFYQGHSFGLVENHANRNMSKAENPPRQDENSLSQADGILEI